MTTDDHHEDVARPADVPARRRARRSRCRSSTRWCRRWRPRAARADAARVRLRARTACILPNFHPAGDGGKPFELTPVLKPLEPLREHVGGRQRPEQHAGARQRPGRRRPHAESRRLAERRAAEADRGRGHHQRQDRRSVRRRQARRRHAAALAGADARIELPGRQLRGRLQLRLPELDVVADAEHAAAARGAIRASSSSGCSATAARWRRGWRRCRRTAASSTR